MNINKKYIIIFGTLILLLVVITGIITYYKEKEIQTQIPNDKGSVFDFSQDYPTSIKETKSFINLCNYGIFSGAEELKDKKIKQIACMLIKAKKLEGEASSFYFPAFMPLDNISSFKSNKYLGISIDLKDVLREYDPSLLEEEKLYFCSISEPSLADSFGSEMKNPKQTLSFNEGDVSCFSAIKDLTIAKNFYMYFYFYGFIPQAESLSIKQFLVDEQTVSDVMNKQSFLEIKEILEDCSIIWQMEKQIIN